MWGVPEINVLTAGRRYVGGFDISLRITTHKRITSASTPCMREIECTGGRTVAAVAHASHADGELAYTPALDWSALVERKLSFHDRSNALASAPGCVILPARSQ